MFTLKEYKQRAMPGDILLIRSNSLIGKLINFGQKMEDGHSRFTHVAIASWKKDSTLFHVGEKVYESVRRIGLNHIRKYDGCEIAVIRYAGMTKEKYLYGIKEVVNNIGQIYPAHRIIFHGLDMINKWIKRKVFRSEKPLLFHYVNFEIYDWPVCSELAAQFLYAAGLEGGWENKKGKRIKGINPDDFDDARFDRRDLCTTIFDGTFVCKE